MRSEDLVGCFRVWEVRYKTGVLFFFLWEVCTVFFVTDLWWLGDLGKAKSVRRTKDAFSHD
jgi:hypothetical protein